MAHRLIKPISKIDRILKTRFLLGNINRLVQVRPFCTEFRKFLSQSTVHLSHEPPKGFDKSVQPKRDNKGKTKGNGNVEKKKNAATKTRNQNSKFGGKNGGGWEEKKRSHRPVFDEHYMAVKFWLFFSTIGGGILVCFNHLWRQFKQNSEIEWDYFVDNYLVRGRVVKLEVVSKKWAQAEIAPGAFFGKATSLWVKIDNLEPHEIIGALAKVVENTGKEMKVELPAVDNQLNLSLRLHIPFISLQGSI